MGNTIEAPAEADKVAGKERDAARKQLIIDYRMTFSGGHGERVLADLRDRFMWARPAWHPGQPVNDGILISGGHHVLAYIEDQITADPNSNEKPNERIHTEG